MCTCMIYTHTCVSFTMMYIVIIYMGIRLLWGWDVLEDFRNTKLIRLHVPKAQCCRMLSTSLMLTASLPTQPVSSPTSQAVGRLAKIRKLEDVEWRTNDINLFAMFCDTVKVIRIKLIVWTHCATPSPRRRMIYGSQDQANIQVVSQGTVESVGLMIKYKKTRVLKMPAILYQ